MGLRGLGPSADEDLLNVRRFAKAVGNARMARAFDEIPVLEEELGETDEALPQDPFEAELEEYERPPKPVKESGVGSLARRAFKSFMGWGRSQAHKPDVKFVAPTAKAQPLRPENADDQTLEQLLLGDMDVDPAVKK